MKLKKKSPDLSKHDGIEDFQGRSTECLVQGCLVTEFLYNAMPINWMHINCMPV